MTVSGWDYPENEVWLKISGDHGGGGGGGRGEGVLQIAFSSCQSRLPQCSPTHHLLFGVYRKRPPVKSGGRFHFNLYGAAKKNAWCSVEMQENNAF